MTENSTLPKEGFVVKLGMDYFPTIHSTFDAAEDEAFKYGEEAEVHSFLLVAGLKVS